MNINKVRDERGRFIGMGKKDVICKYCNKKFSSFIVNNRKFCSNKCKNNFAKVRYLGENNPFYGKKHDERARKSMSNSRFKIPISQRIPNMCIVCNKDIFKSNRESWKDYKERKFCSKPCSSKYNAQFTSPFGKGIFFSHKLNCNCTRCNPFLRKGKTHSEIFGKEKATTMSLLNSLKNKGKRKSVSTEFKKGHITWNTNLTKENNEKVKENGQKTGKTLKRKWQNEEYKEKQIIKIFEGLKLRPTSYEKKISEICIENSLPFIYTGNGAFLIGHKNPDFVDKENKIAIEVYNDYFKIRDFGSCEEYEKQRSEYFAKYGWKTIFIRKNMIASKDWKNICLDKIQTCKGVHNGFFNKEEL